MHVALNSYGDIATGLGSEARWLWNLLPFGSWIQGEHVQLGWGRMVLDHGRPIFRSRPKRFPEVVVCIERPVPFSRQIGNYGGEVAAEVKAAGARLVVLANPEWTPPGVDWLPFADTVVARTDQCWRHLRGLGIETVPRAHVPLDITEFPFTQRSHVRTVRFTNGWGGIHRRKGWPEVQGMMRRGLRVQLLSQRPIGGRPACPVFEGSRLYAGADLMLAPSRFEGVGLTILEAMASGCLIAATDAEPMSEFVRAAYGADAWRFLLPVARTEQVRIGHQLWPAHFVDPVRAVKAVREIQALPEEEVRRTSRAGRDYIESCHGVAAARELWGIITGATP